MTVQPDDTGLRMSLLGRFEVRAGDDVIIDEVWHHRNAKALLKLLAVQRDRSLHREQVLDAFWASLNPSAAAANLRKILFDLRAEFTARQVKADRQVGLPGWCSEAAMQAGGGRMPFKDEGYDDEQFWERVNSNGPTFLGFWTHQ